jgi:hypothetical protein
MNGSGFVILSTEFVVTVDPSKSLEEMIRQGNYTRAGLVAAGSGDASGSSDSGAWDPKSRVVPGERRLRLVQPSEPTTTTDIALKLWEHSIEPANMQELLEFGARYPAMQTRFPIVGPNAQVVYWGDQDTYGYAVLFAAKDADVLDGQDFYRWINRSDLIKEVPPDYRAVTLLDEVDERNSDGSAKHFLSRFRYLCCVNKTPQETLERLTLKADVSPPSVPPFDSAPPEDPTRVYSIELAGNETVSALLDTSSYQHVHPAIPLCSVGQVEAGVRRLRLLQLDSSIHYDDAGLALQRAGLRAARLEELLAFGARYPEVLRHRAVVTVGVSIRAPAQDGTPIQSVPFLYGTDYARRYLATEVDDPGPDYRGIDLYNIRAVLGAKFRFLAVEGS